MGGQYEPHFDFSRVRPKSPKSTVLAKGPVPAALRRLEFLEALQPPQQAPLTSPGLLFVIGKAPVWNHGPRAQGGLAVSPVMWGTLLPPDLLSFPLSP